MKEDFDFVSMENYQKDTEALVDQAAAIIADLKRKKEQAELLLYCIIEVCKEVRIPEHLIIEAEKGKLSIIREEDPSTREIIFKKEKRC